MVNEECMHDHDDGVNQIERWWLFHQETLFDRLVFLFFAGCTLNVVHCTSSFQFDSKVMAPISWFKGQHAVEAVCGDSTARICFAPWMSECQRRWALFVFFAFMQAGAVCLFVSFFICLFTLPSSYIICLFMLMENQYSDFTCLSLNYSNLDKSDACVWEYNTPAVPTHPQNIRCRRRSDLRQSILNVKRLWIFSVERYAGCRWYVGTNMWTWSNMLIMHSRICSQPLHVRCDQKKYKCKDKTQILVYVPILSGNQVWSVGILSLLKSINGSPPLSPIILSAIVSLWCYVDNFYI